MNRKEFKFLEKKAPIDENRIIFKADYINSLGSQTLLYGYTIERYTYHMYIDFDGVFNIIIYDEDKIIKDSCVLWDDVRANDIFLPDKRLYPECCHFEVCKILKNFGFYLPFTTFNENREYRLFHGKIIDDNDGSLKDA